MLGWNSTGKLVVSLCVHPALILRNSAVYSVVRIAGLPYVRAFSRPPDLTPTQCLLQMVQRLVGGLTVLPLFSRHAQLSRIAPIARSLMLPFS